MKQGQVEQRHGARCTGADRCGCPWRYRLDGPAGVDGRRRQVTKGGFRTKTEAREAMADVQRRIADGEQVGRSQTVGAYLDDWLAAKEHAGRRASTLAQYRLYVAQHIKPALGHVRLADLGAHHLDGLVESMRAAGKGLPTQHRVMACLSSALATAERRRLISHNPCRQVELPAERTPLRPVYDAAQLRRFLAHVADDRLAALWRLYGAVGLRRGEALALRWADVDLDAAELRVERSLGVVDGRLAWGPPKSERGRRTIALDAGTVAALRTHRAGQSAERLALGAAYADHDLVFARQDGAPLRPEWVTRRFHALTRQAGLPSIHLHDLRHSAASLALAAGVPMKVVSENLGHSTLAVTANVYSHVTSDVARQAADQVGAVLDGSR